MNWQEISILFCSRNRNEWKKAIEAVQVQLGL